MYSCTEYTSDIALNVNSIAEIYTVIIIALLAIISDWRMIQNLARVKKCEVQHLETILK